MEAGGRQGTLQPHQNQIPGSQATDLGKEGLRGGLCIFLYLWQTAVLAWFECPMETSTFQPKWSPRDTSGHLLPTLSNPAPLQVFSFPPDCGLSGSGQ